MAKSQHPESAHPESAQQASQEVVERPHFVLRNAEGVAEFLRGDWVVGSDREDGIIGILDQVMSASDEDLFAEMPEAESWRTFADEAMNGGPETVFVLTGGARFLHSDDKYINDRTIVPAFAVVQAVDQNGEMRVLTTGSFKAVAQLREGWRRGMLEGKHLALRGKVVRNSGYVAYSLVEVK